PRPERSGVARFLAQPAIPWFLAASALLHAAHAAYDVTFSLHLGALGVADGWIGVAWAVGVAAEVALFSRSGRLIARLGHERLLVVAAAGAAIRWAAIACVGDAAGIIALQPLHALSFGCMWLAATGIVAKHAPAGHLA